MIRVFPDGNVEILNMSNGYDRSIYKNGQLVSVPQNEYDSYVRNSQPNMLTDRLVINWNFSHWM